LITVGFAVLTHFLLVFPKAKPTLARRSIAWLIYGPAAVVGLLATWVLIVATAATSGVNVFLRVLFGLFVVGYFGASLIAFAHGYVKAAPQARAARGLNLILVGAVVGLAPSIAISVVGLVAPQIVVPGAQFLPLGVGLLPVTFAIAAVKGELTAQVSG